MNVKFEYIFVKNFLSYSNEGIRFDFNNVGLNAIIGENGAGKSSIITDALCFNLYGEPYRKIKKDELINRTNKKGMYTESQFSISNDVYKVVRGRKPDVFEIYKNGEELNTLSTKALSQEEIDKIIGINHKMFRNVIALAVNYNKPFLELSKQEKRDIIELMFNVNIFGDMLKILKTKITKLKTDIEIDKNSVDLLTENIRVDEKRIEEIEQSEKNFYAELEQKKKQIEQKIVEIDNHIKNNLTLIDINQQKIVELDKQKESKKKEYLQKIEEYDNKIEMQVIEIGHEFDAKISDYENKLKEMQEKIDVYSVKTEQDIQEKNKAISALKEENSEQKEELLLKVKKIEETVKAKITELIVEKSKIVQADEDKYYTEKVNINSKIQFRKESIKEKKVKIAFFKKNDVCPECNHEIGEEEKKVKIGTLEKEIEKYESDLIEFQKSIEGINEALEQSKENKLKYVKIEKDIEKIEQAKNQKIDEYQKKIFMIENSKEVDSLQNQLNDLVKDFKYKKDVFSSKVAEKDEKVKSFENEKQYKIESLKNSSFKIEIQNMIRELDERVEQHSRTKDIESISKENANYEKQKEEILTEKDILKSKVFDIDISKIKKQFKEKMRELKDVESKYNSNLELIDSYRITKELLGEKGIKSFFFKKLIPILNQKISHYLDRFELPISVVFDEQLNEEISSYSGGEKGINYNSFSAGERKRIDISLLLSFIDITKLITNWSCNVQVWDEVLDSGVDNKGLNQLIKNMKDYVEKKTDMVLYIVSHKLQETGYFDNIIEIEKRGNFSYIK